MSSIPRILPLVGIAMVGVLAINAVAGARDLPGMLSGAKAFAEEAADKAAKAVKGKDGEAAATGDAKDANAVLPAPTIKPVAACAPTAAELAKEAGLSPAELQVLQNLGQRRGQLDQREEDLSTQLALLAAAQAKLDAKVQALNALKGDITGLLGQADSKEAAEVDRLVKVFEGMKAKDAAPRMVLLDDSVRLPIAAKMKERALSAILAQMPPAEAKRLTESLSRRFSAAQTLAANATNAANAAAAKTPAPSAADAARTADAGKTDAAKPPARKRSPAKQAKKAPARKAAPASAEAASAAAKPDAATTAPAAAAAGPKAG